LQGEQVDGDAAAELAALVAPADPQTAAAFAASELAPRVTALCTLHSWVQQAQQAELQRGHQASMQHSGTQPEEAGALDSKTVVPVGDGRGGAAEAARQAGLLMWRQLLALADTNPELSAPRCNEMGLLHRKKARDGRWMGVGLGECFCRALSVMTFCHTPASLGLLYPVWVACMPAGAAVAGAVRAVPTCA
jgi:hypothetical protein